jgi:hypothetical protein
MDEEMGRYVMRKFLVAGLMGLGLVGAMYGAVQAQGRDDNRRHEYAFERQGYYFGYTHDSYQDVANRVVANGQRIVYSDGYEKGNFGPRFVARFAQAERDTGWISRHALNADALDDFIREWVSRRNFQVDHLDSYATPDGILYTITATETGRRTGNQRHTQRIVHGLDPDTWRATFDEAVADGYTLISTSVVATENDQIEVSGVFRLQEFVAFASWYGLTAEQLLRMDAEQAANGLEPVFVESYTSVPRDISGEGVVRRNSKAGDSPLYVAIWRADAPAAELTVGLQGGMFRAAMRQAEREGREVLWASASDRLGSGEGELGEDSFALIVSDR